MKRSGLLVIVILVLAAAGCGGPEVASTPTGQPVAEVPASTATSPVEAGPTVAVSTGEAANPTTGAPTVQPSPSAAARLAKAVIANSELIVGDNRFVLGLLDVNTGQPVNYVPEVGVQFFKVHDDGTATKTDDGQVVYRGENLPAGLFVSHATFSEPGNWGAIVTVRPEGDQPYQQQINFTVVADSSVPVAGEPAPRSRNQTVADVASVGEICSAHPEDGMHDITIAEAVTSGKPSVILFAAPGFCPSFTCGPDLEMTSKLREKYGDRVNFIHIESPNEIQTHTHEGAEDAEHRQEEGHQGVSKPQVKTAEEWGLKSEPWLFIVGADGNVSSAFEGGLTIDEVEPELVKTLD